MVGSHVVQLISLHNGSLGKLAFWLFVAGEFVTVAVKCIYTPIQHAHFITQRAHFSAKSNVVYL